MVDEVVLAGLDALRRGEIDAISLANCLDLFPSTGEADESRVKLGKISLEHGRCVARRITGDEDGSQGFRLRGLDDVNHHGHLVEFFRTDVWAVGEAEVYLSPSHQQNHG